MRHFKLLIISSFGLTSCWSNDIKEENAKTEVLYEIDTNHIEVVQLARPNSGTYTFSEAEELKHNIYQMQLTSKFFEWTNPTTGGALHITTNDEIELYQSTTAFLDDDIIFYENISPIMSTRPKKLDTAYIIDQSEILKFTTGIGDGNVGSVLITSEINPHKSRSMEIILQELFEPATQIYYLKIK